MKTSDPKFWAELTQSNVPDLPGIGEILDEDIEPNTAPEDEDTDDSVLPVNALIETMMTMDIPSGVGTQRNGTLTSIADTENADLNPADQIEDTTTENAGPVEQGRGKRTRQPSTRYAGFWRHYDQDNWRDDSK